MVNDKIKIKVLSALSQRRKQFERNRDAADSRDPDEGFSYYKPEDPITVIRSLEFEIERIFENTK